MWHIQFKNQMIKKVQKSKKTVWFENSVYIPGQLINILKHFLLSGGLLHSLDTPWPKLMSYDWPELWETQHLLSV